MVLATQNPYEFEGTYFLPENQLDRFMLRLRIGYPDAQAEKQILNIRPARTRLGDLAPVMSVPELVAIQDQVSQVRADEAIVDYVLAIAEATRRSQELTVGLSPRGSLALLQAARAQALLDGRDYVVPDDVKDLAVSVCAHRLMARSMSHDGTSAASEQIFEQILKTVRVPE
jgi:MoxR-like ATPase